LAASGIEYVLTRRKGRQRLLLLDMDGTLTTSRFVSDLARATGQEEALTQLFNNPDFQSDDKQTQNDKTASLFRFVHMQKFDEVARNMEIRPGVIEFVNKMRRLGFMVGVLCDSYFVAADIIRRRIFADFAMAHTIQFDGEVCNGQLNINPAFMNVPDGGFGFPGRYATSHDTAKRQCCKSNVLRSFLADTASPPINLTWVIGDDQEDYALMQLADQSFVIDASQTSLLNEPGITRVASFADLSAHLPPEA
jgi:glucosyl-3-phosphoglycerate synthase